MKLRRSSLSGEVTLPPSKSQTIRALLFALASRERSSIENPLSSPDTQAMMEACSLLGAEIEVHENRLNIKGGLKPAEDVIDCGNSGLVLRLIGGISALLPSYTILTGDDSIRHRRKVLPLLEGLNQLGAWGVSTRGDGYAPIAIRGCVRGGIAHITGEDSQPVSALLIAAALAPEEIELFVQHPGELPWIKMTLSWLDRFQLSYENKAFEHYKIKGGGKIPGFSYKVPADWSSALYLIAAAIVTDSEITLRGLDFQDPQGDKEVVFLLQQMGAHLTIGSDFLTVHPGAELHGVSINIDPFIDAITLLPVIACRAQGVTHIYGGSIARFKESDRIQAIVSELKKMGALIEERPDGMVVYPSELQGTQVLSFQDHRMALALSIAALMAQGTTEIVGAETVSKSFPGYFALLHRMGASVE